MDINGTIINTPFDVYPEYDPAWRHHVAKALISKPNTIIPEELAKDKWIREHMAFLQQNKKQGLKNKSLWMHKMALDWFSGGVVNSMKTSIEALLLTEASYEIIALDMLSEKHDAKLIQLYERLFFDCRREDGTPTEGAFRRRWLALPQDARINADTILDIFWKLVAQQMGYAGLMSHWKLTGYHGTKPTMAFHMEVIRNYGSTMLQERMIRGTISNRDLVDSQKNVLEYDRQMMENKDENGLSNVCFRTVLELAKQLYPVKYESIVDEATKQQLNEAYKAKLLAESQIKNQMVADAGPQASLNALNAQMSAHIESFKKDKSQIKSEVKK